MLLSSYLRTILLMITLRKRLNTLNLNPICSKSSSCLHLLRKLWKIHLLHMIIFLNSVVLRPMMMERLRNLFCHVYRINYFLAELIRKIEISRSLTLTQPMDEAEMCRPRKFQSLCSNLKLGMRHH